MIPNIWRLWVSRLFTRKTRVRPRKPRRLSFEYLEDRVVPTATDTWMGTVNGLWSNASNWVQSTGGNSIPTTGEIVVFSNSAVSRSVVVSNLTTIPDLSELNFAGTGYTLSGADALEVSGNITVNQNAGPITVSNTLEIDPSPTPQFTIAVNSGATLDLTGQIVSEVSGTTVSKTQIGTLILAGNNTTFTGNLSLVTSGGNSGGYVQVQSYTGLGSTAVTVESSTQLQLNPLSQTITAASESGTTVTITTAAALVGISAGQSVTIANIFPNGYDGTFTVLTVSANKFTYTDRAGLGGADIVGATATEAFNLTNSLILNGSGVVGDGALLNANGVNTWSGPVTMDSDSTFGVDAGTLTVSGGIGDNSTGHNLFKVGPGTLIFPGANTYRGDTTVSNGILEIENPLALGYGATYGETQNGSPNSETIVTDNPTDNLFGTLELNFNAADVSASNPNAILNGSGSLVGFQVFGDILVLNGPGFTDANGNTLGALYNASGDNEWDGSILLGSLPPEQANPAININANTQLIASGVLSDPNQRSQLTVNSQADTNATGELILNNDDTYRGVFSFFNDGGGTTSATVGTFVQQGILDIGDSKALGTGAVVVYSGASLDMDVDSGYDGTALRTFGRNLGFDSVTGTGPGQEPGPGQELDITTSSAFNLMLGGQTSATMSVTDANFVGAGNGSTGELATDVDILLTNAGLAGETVSSVTQDGNIYRLLFSGPNNDIELMTTNNANVDVNPIYGLKVSNELFLSGSGFGVNPDGALDSHTGLNVWTGTINLGPDGISAIGVDADSPPSGAPTFGTDTVYVNRFGHPLADNDYLQWDYSLTVTGAIVGGDLTKTGFGDLILPNANDYGNTQGVNAPTTDIQLGWITINNDQALGFNSDPASADLPQTLEPYVQIQNGGALHLDPAPGTSLTMYYNFLVEGLGLTSQNYGLIEQAGAIENLSGDNTLAGIVQLDEAQTVTIPAGASGSFSLTFNGVGTGAISVSDPNLAADMQTQLDKLSTVGGVGGSASVIYLGNGVYSVNFGGTLTGAAVPLLVANDGVLTAFENAGIGVEQIPATIADPPNTGFLGSITITAASETNTTVTITTSSALTGLAPGDTVAIAGISPPGYDGDFTVISVNGKMFTYTAAALLGTATLSNATATLQPSLNASQLTLTGYLWNYGDTASGLTKLGSRRLIIQGSGTYTGNVAVQDGVLLAQNSTALGKGYATSNFPTVTVATGASLEMGNTVNDENVGNGLINEDGGVQAGLEIWGEDLVLNGSGDPTFVDSALTVLAGNAPASGPTVQTVTVTGNLTAAGSYTLSFGAQTATIAANATAAQMQADLDALTTIGAGGVEVAQYGNVYLVTFVGSSIEYTTLPLVAGVSATYTGTYAVVAGVQQGSAAAPFAPVNDPIVATDDAWRGPVTLANNTTITTDTNPELPASESAARLVISGSIGDDYPASPPANLTILGGGEVDLDGANTYAGMTYVQQGVVSLGNAQALGGAGIAAVQTLALASLTANTHYMLTYNGLTGLTATSVNASFLYSGDSTLAQVNTTAASIASTLNGLINTSGSETDGNATVTVTPISAAITAASENGTTVTITTSSNLGLTVGQNVIVSGITPTGYDGNFIVTGVSNIGGKYQFSYTASGGLSTGGLSNALATLPGSFTISFGGSLSGFPFNPIQVFVPGSPPTPITANIVTAGTGGTVVESGASMEVAGSFTVAGEPLILQGTGATLDQQQLNVTPGAGNFVLSFSGADASGNSVTDNTPTADPSASITAATETGATVTITASAALGGLAVGQYVNVGGVANTGYDGNFQVTSVNNNTDTYTYTTAAGLGASGSVAIATITGLEELNTGSSTLISDVEFALDALSNIGGVGGNVTVTETAPNVYTITFGGTLAGQDVQTLVSNNGGVSVTPLTAGSQTIAGVPTQWFQVGPAPAADGQTDGIGTLTIVAASENATTVTITTTSTPNGLTAGQTVDIAGITPSGYDGSFTVLSVTGDRFTYAAAPGLGLATLNNATATDNNDSVSGQVTSVAVDPNDPTVMYVGTAGGGVWKSIDNGNSWQPIFNAIPEVQTLTIAAGTTGSFTINFTGPNSIGTVVTDTTTPINPASGTLTSDVQDALDALTNLGGVGGQVTVTESTSGGVITLMITFNGTLAGEALAPQVSFPPPASPPPVPSTTLTLNTATLAGGSVTAQEIEQAQDPNFAMYVGAVAVDPDNSNIIYVGTGVLENSTYPGLTDGETESDGSTDAYYGTGVYESTDGGLTWSLLLDNTSGINAFGQEIPNPVTGTYLINPFYGMSVSAIAVDPQTQTLFVADGSVYGVGYGDGVPNGGVNEDADVNDLTGMVEPGGTGQLAGVWRFTPGSSGTLGTWFDLTDYTTSSRATLDGQQKYPPDFPGPDDDFRINFPEVPDPYTAAVFGEIDSNVWWTDVQVIDTGIQNDGGEPQNGMYEDPGPPVPVVYASLGSPEGGEAPYFGWTIGGGFNQVDSYFPIRTWAAVGGVNAVYRAYNPLSDSPTWYIGDPGKPADQVESITITDPGGGVAGYTLDWPVFADQTGDINPYSPANPNLGALQFALDGLMGFGNVIVSIENATATTTVFYVTFVGALSDSPEALIGVVDFNNEISSIVVGIVTPGGGVDTESTDEFPTALIDGASANNGDIKLAIVQPPPTNAAGQNTDGAYWVTGYASVPNSGELPNGTPTFSAQAGDLLNIMFSLSASGYGWVAIPGAPDFMNGQGNYDNAIVAVDATTFYVGGGSAEPASLVSSVENPTDMVYEYSNGIWTNLTQDVNLNSPHNAVHALVIAGPTQFDDATNEYVTSGNILTGTDGGIWSLDTGLNSAGTPINDWSDLNSNLAIAQVNGVSAAQSNPEDIIAGLEGNGLATNNTTALSGLLTWTETDQDEIGGTEAQYGIGPSGGTVYIDPNNSSIIYAVLDSPAPDGTYSDFLESTNGGASWTPIYTIGDAQEYPYFPFLIDPLNPNRILIGTDDGLFQSLAGVSSGAGSFIDLGPSSVTAMAVAGYQGVFEEDPRFSDVSDIGANQDDPNTIYVTDGTNLYLTKDSGLNWVTCTPPITAGATIESITVNPANRDNVFVVTQGTPSNPYPGNGITGLDYNQVYESNDAGQSWTLIGGGGASIGGLGDIPLWQLQIDPRTGTLYVGTDNGVYELAGASPLNPNGPVTIPASDTMWTRFGIGMPNVSVHVLQLDMTTNTLVAGTYGGGIFELDLDSSESTPTPVNAAIAGVSGNSVWTGSVMLLGDSVTNSVTIAAQGTQGIPDGITAASIDFLGQVSDLVAGSNPTLVKGGDGDVIFSGANIYGGQTLIGEGNLIGNNLDALGGTNAAITAASENNTTVMITTSAPVVGLSAGQSVIITGLAPGGYDGTFTVIGVNGNTFTYTDASGLGNASLSDAMALVETGGATVVYGASLGLLNSLDSVPVILNGNGISFDGHNLGALRNISSTNTFSGNITLEPGPDDLTTNSVTILPVNSVTIDADSGSTLILTGTISGGLDLGNSGVTSFTLVKEGTGTVVLDPSSADGNAYDGTTAIYQGALVAENSNAFGYALFPANAVEVLDGAQLQLSGAIDVFNSLYLSGSGIDNSGAILDIGGDNTWTGTITLEILPGFTPFTLTPGTVAVGADAGDILTLAGEIEEESATTNTLPLTTPSALPDNELPIGLDKVDPGTVALSNANTYTGETQVLEGYLDVQNDAALGARTAADTQTIEQIITLSDSGPNGEGTGNFTLSWNSKPAVKVLSFGASATAVQDALEGPPGTGLFASAGTVTVYRTAVQNTAADGLAYIGAPPPPNSSEVTGWVYTLVFGGGLAETTDQVKAVGSLGTVASASVVADGGNDVVVANNLLGSGELELDNSALPSGNLVIPNYTLTLNGSGPSGTITVTPGATGGFVLKYTGPNIGGTVVTDSTPASGAGELKASSPTLAGDIENALDNLANIGGVGDNVVVTATSTAGVFAIQFIGGLPSLAVATQPASGSVSIQESQGALENLVGNNTWSGLIVLETNSTVGAAPNSSMYLTDVDSVATQFGGATPVAPMLDVIGPSSIPSADSPGTVIFPAGATYTQQITYNTGDTVTSPGLSVVSAGGYLEVDADNFSPILLNGGILSGKGSISPTNSLPSISDYDTLLADGIGGTIDPGDNFPAEASGIITSTSTLKLTANDELYVNIGSPWDGLQNPGNNNDVLDVNGAVTLGNANLNGLVGTSVVVDEPYTIVTATSVSGTFNPGLDGVFPGSQAYEAGANAYTVAYIDGVRFEVDYFNTRVDVIRTLTPVSATVTASNLSPVYGQDEQFIATFSSSDKNAPPVTGTADFYVTNPVGTTIEYQVQIVSGVATLDLPTVLHGPLQVGGLGYSVYMDYTGLDANGNQTFEPIVNDPSPPLTVTVAPAGTTVVDKLVGYPSPEVYGETFTINATVTSTVPTPPGVVSGTLDPAGSVNFYDSTVNIQSASWASSVATITTSSIPSEGAIAVGQTITITGMTSTGPGSYNGTFVVNSVVNNANSTTFTYALGTNPGTAAAYGVVDSNLLASVSLTPTAGSAPPSSTASLTSASMSQLLGIGDYSIVAVYEPSTNPQNYTAGAPASIALPVNQDGTTVSVVLTSPPPPLDYGQPGVKFTATVNPLVPPGVPVTAGTPTGIVTFLDNSLVLGTGTLVPNGGGFGSTATFTTMSGQLLEGNTTITVVYPGDTNYTGNTGTLAETVGPAPSVITNLVSNSPLAGSPPVPTASYGTPVTFTATLTAGSPGGGSPSGTVNFFYTPAGGGGPVEFGSATTVTTSGVTTAAFTTNPSVPSSELPAGYDYVTATFTPGNSNFSGTNTSPTVTEDITPAEPTTSVASNSATVGGVPTSVYGQPVTFTATVTPPQGQPTPTGTVNFYLNSTSNPPIGTGTLGTSSGVTTATYTTTAGQLPVGNPDLIIAVYEPAAGSSYASSQGTLDQDVTQDSTTTTISSSGPAAPSQTSVTFSVIVSANPPGGGNPTGAVTFQNLTTGQPLTSTTSQTSATLSIVNGMEMATFTVPTSQLVPGVNTIQANYSGDSNFEYSSGTMIESVGDTTSVSVSSSPTSPTPVYGQTVTLTATITPQGSPNVNPTGTVTFICNGTTLGVPGVSTSGGVTTAVLQVTSLAVGSDTVYAYYSGDNTFGASQGETSPPVTIDKDNTTTTLSALGGISSAEKGETVLLTAQVGVVAPGSGNPTGTVTFKDTVGSTTTTLGTGTLSGGVASVQAVLSSTGTNDIVAYYGGDGNDSTSNSAPPLVIAVSATGARAASITLSSSVNPSIFGNPVTFTAIVKDSGASITPTGTVSFFSGTTLLGYGTLSADGTGKAMAALTTSALPQGTDSITARYNGDGTFAYKLSAVLSQTVEAGTTTLAVGTSEASAPYGTALTFTATVTDAGAATPSGTVTFTAISGSTTIALGSATLSGSSGVATATLNYSALNVGTYTIQATYGGDTATVGQTITPAQAGIIMTPSIANSTYGQSVTFTATVSTPGASSVPSGTVNFLVNGSTVATNVALSKGKATYKTSSLPAPGDEVEVVYNGSTNLSTNSYTLDYTVNQDATKLGLTTSTTANAPITMTATVGATSPGSGTPTGIVYFYINGNLVGQGTLSGGKTTITANEEVAPGTYPVEIVYSGDNNFESNSFTKNVDFTTGRGT